MQTYIPLDVDAYKQQFKDSGVLHLLLDVRTPEEFEQARIPGTVLVPLDELSERVGEVAEMAGELPIVVVCRTGIRSIMGAQILRYGGIKQDLYNLEGGTQSWAMKRLPLDSGPESEA
jgi:rhodanese-related sulfurtransferase